MFTSDHTIMIGYHGECSILEEIHPNTQHPIRNDISINTMPMQSVILMPSIKGIALGYKAFKLFTYSRMDLDSYK